MTLHSINCGKEGGGVIFHGVPRKFVLSQFTYMANVTGLPEMRVERALIREKLTKDMLAENERSSFTSHT